MVQNTRRYTFGALLIAAVLGFTSVAVSAVIPDRHPGKGITAPAMIAPKAAPVLGANAQGQETASLLGRRLFDRMAVRLAAGRRLSEEDAARYAHIFAFQDVANFAHADTEIKKLSDKRLMGHVLYQRYMHPDYKTSYKELAAWMDTYADLPNAQGVYDLAQRRKGKETTALKSPKTTRGVYGQHDFDVGQPVQPLAALTKYSPRARDIIRAVDAHLGKSPSVAFKKINTDEAKKLFQDVQYDSLRADVAGSYFYNQKADKAFELASASADRSGDELPMAGWVAGLAAWKLGQYENAAKYFEIAATAKRASPWMASGASYWAARSYMQLGVNGRGNMWLKRAAEYPRTFYGIIAMKALGRTQNDFNWDQPILTERHLRALSETAAGRRAIALVDAERPDLAESELKQINPGSDHVLQEAVIALASHAGMPGLAMRLGSAFKSKGGDLYDAALYPNAPWKPEKGFDVDRALVYAFIRQESNFDPNARNRGSGAVGLMQLMPSTAKHVASKAGDAQDSDKLRDPTVNIDLGQRYLKQLLSQESINGNLFKLAVAYNAGPGKLSRWQQTIGADDPLFFIESIPVAETRVFVERVLANYWIYSMKFGQDTRSLDRVAEGEWPSYLPQDTRQRRTFADAANFFMQ